MEQELYEITLSDGTVLSNLTINGNNFVSNTEVTKATFNGKLSNVTIKNVTTGEELEYENMVLVQITQYQTDPSRYYFVLRELTQKELEEINLRADIDYALMMLDDDF